MNCLTCQNDAPPPSGGKKKSTKFDRVINDFVGKRYGAGNFFYGARESELTEEEYQERLLKSNPTRDVDYETMDLKENAILIYGGDSEIGQWMVYELVEKGFNVRIATEKRDDAVKLFGKPGFNVDIVQVPEDIQDREIIRAIQGCQAIIFCNAFNPVSSSRLQVESKKMAVASKMIALAIAAQKAKVGTLKKLVALSRAVPNDIVSSSQSPKLPIFGGENVCASKYDEFRALHERFDDRVRSAGSFFDYVIVRAPTKIESAREGALYELSLVQDADLSSYSPSARIGALDLAEGVVQSLVQDVSTTTFTLTESSTNAVDSTDKAFTRSAAMEDEVISPLPVSSALAHSS